MAEIIINASPMWHPTNGLDLTTYMKLPQDQRQQSYFEFEGDTPETASFYIGICISGNQRVRYRINKLYAQYYSGSYEYKHCGVFYLDNRNKYILELRNDGSGSQNALMFNEYYQDVYNSSINTWTTIVYGQTRSISIDSNYIAANGCININTPYIPIFATNELATAYLNDPEDETIYSQALNYYNPVDHSQPHYEMRRYFWGVNNSIEDYINSIFDVDNSNYNNFIDNVLDPINNLVKSRLNMDYDTSINESLQKVKDTLTQVVNLKSMQLVNNPTENDKQIAFPNKIFTPLTNFTPFTQAQLETIINNFSNREVTANKGFFLLCGNYNSTNNYYEIYCCTFENKDGTHEYSNLYLTKTGTSLAEKVKPEYYLQGGNVTINKLSWGSSSIERYYYYPGTDTIIYITSINTYNISNNKRYILFNRLNTDIPFYCSGNVYVAYRENDTDDWKNYLFLQKNGNIELETMPISSALMHIKPIIMLYNRYQLSFLNGWDGNKLETGDYYMIAPQVGAGIKEDDNSFSGVVMGTKLKDINTAQDRLIGLFGEYHGRQSFFLNADDGSAIFGLEKKGQITLDPTQQKALIYSGNYWKDYRYDGKPSNYTDSNKTYQGMMIDLTTPEIRFGNGNFVVNNNGHVTAKGGGSIAGWRIGNSELYSNVNKSSGRLTLDSGTITLNGYSVEGTYSSQTIEFYIYCDVSSDSQTAKIRRIKYNNSWYDNWTLSNYDTDTHTGQITISGITITITVDLTSDSAVYNYVSGRPIVDVYTNYQYPGKFYSHGHDNLNATNTGFYLSYDGFSIGSKFRIDSSGILQATDALLTGTIHVTGNGISTIGNWTVNNDNLYSRVTRTSSPAGTFDITIGSDGNMFGKKLISNNPETWETQWEIKRNGDCYFKNIYGEVPSGKNLKISGNLIVDGSATINGTLTAAGGNVSFSGASGGTSKICGFTINSDSFTGTNIQIYSNTGYIYCEKLFSDEVSAPDSLSTNSLKVSGNGYSSKSITYVDNVTFDGSDVHYTTKTVTVLAQNPSS